MHPVIAITAHAAPDAAASDLGESCSVASGSVASDSGSPSSVALAILYQDDRYLFQLRDDLPHIRYPGHWGLFGGHLEAGETAAIALQRELAEEIGYVPPQLDFFQIYADADAIRYLYAAPLTVALDQLQLQEGMDLALLSPEAIASGSYFSTKIGQVRPLGAIHQRILLDFIRQQP